MSLVIFIVCISFPILSPNVFVTHRWSFIDIVVLISCLVMNSPYCRASLWFLSDALLLYSFDKLDVFKQCLASNSSLLAATDSSKSLFNTFSISACRERIGLSKSWPYHFADIDGGIHKLHSIR